MLRSQLADIVASDLTAEADEAACLACGAEGLVAFYETLAIPTQTCVLLESLEESRSYPQGELLLGFCETCGFIQNVRFSPELVDYTKPTEESQAYSPKFQQFAESLADDLVTRYDLAQKTVLEVGCGKGDFLRLLDDRGIGSGLGIDPGFIPNRPDAGSSSIVLDRSSYDGSRTGLTADLVITRHLMEHVANVNEFFSWLAESTLATDGASLFTEVPDVLRVLDEGAFWDVYYEHCSYFTLGSLARSLRRVGLEVTDLTMGFDNQYLLAHARPGDGSRIQPNEDAPREVAAKVASFASTAKSRVTAWRDRIGSVVDGGGSVAVWGGGSKAVAFLATVGADPVTVVDINPHKQGKWLPSVGIEVQAPSVLVDLRPELVIPMNSIYRSEIEGDLASMGLTPRVEPV